jgi:hypothetical protein
MRKYRRTPPRILTACFAATLGCLLVACVPAQASESLEVIHRVSVEQVRQLVLGELRSRAIGEEQLPSVGDIEVPLCVPMRSGSTLRVSSVCWDQDAQRVRFQIKCGQQGECLPFLAYVRTAPRTNAPACRMESARAARNSSEPGPRAGARATAVFSRAGIRINTAVTCLQGGDRGDIIRVRGYEGRIFRARIIGPSLVDASLE